MSGMLTINSTWIKEQNDYKALVPMKFPDTSQIMITGGAGMIGANLVRRLVQDGRRVTVVDNL